MPVTPRDAATVILVRPAEGGAYEVLMTRRPASMAFMGGTFVFPGGTLDVADSSNDMAARSALSRKEAKQRLGEEIAAEQALGLFCCGARELYEEAGVLLATEEADRPVNPAKVREIYAPHHADVGHDAAVFSSFMAGEGLTLSTDLLQPHGRLVTPEQAPIRFDARFFIAPMPEGQAVFPHPTEVVEWLWITPTGALERARSKDLDIPIPTLAILQGLAEIPGYEQVLGGVQRPRSVEAEELSPLITVVRSPNPGLMTGGGTNTYIVGRGDVAIIDPAVPDPVYIERVAREAGNHGRAKIVLITHSHFDHLGGVVPLIEQMRMEVAAFGEFGDLLPLLPVNSGCRSPRFRPRRESGRDLRSRRVRRCHLRALPSKCHRFVATHARLVEIAEYNVATDGDLGRRLLRRLRTIERELERDPEAVVPTENCRLILRGEKPG